MLALEVQATIISPPVLKKKIIRLTGIDLWDTSILTAWPHTYLLFQIKNYFVVDKIKISF